MSADMLDDASDAEEQFRQRAIENARRKIEPGKICPCCQGRLHHEDGWLVCQTCGYERDLRV